MAVYVKRYGEAHTPLDLALIDTLSGYERTLKGPIALTPEQVAKIKDWLVKRQAGLEELGQLAERLSQYPEDGAAKQRVFAVLDGLQPYWGLSIAEQRALFTLEQRRALGLEPDPNAKPREPRRSVTAAVSSGGDDGGLQAKEMAKQMAEYEKQQARATLAEKVMRRSAPIRFELTGRNAATSKLSIRTADGLMWMFVDERSDHSGGSYLFYLDQEKSWTWEKAKLLKEVRDQEAELKANPAALKENPDALTEAARWRDRLEKAPSYHAYSWTSPLEQLRAKAGAVPRDVRERLEGMTRDMTDATAALLTAYRAAVSRPFDADLQRALFEAMRRARRIEQRNDILTMRQFHDEEGDADDLPWLLSMDQVDLIAQGSLVTASEVSSGSGGSLSISARPAGEKQYVSVTADGPKLGELAESVQRVARKYYHNHRLTLTVDAKATDNRVRGMVEGKSAEELFKSLANRCGVHLEKDEKVPHQYHLKP